MEVHDRIRKLRERNNITREAFAQKIGVTYAAMSKYETGKRQPDYETLQKIADYFEVSADYLLGREEKPRQSDQTEFEAWVNDPKVDKFYREFNESPDERKEALLAVWEILKKQGK